MSSLEHEEEQAAETNIKTLRVNRATIGASLLLTLSPKSFFLLYQSWLKSPKKWRGFIAKKREHHFLSHSQQMSCSLQALEGLKLATFYTHFSVSVAERSGNFEDEEVSHLMEIYIYLDEPDGLSGLWNQPQFRGIRIPLTIYQTCATFRPWLLNVDGLVSRFPQYKKAGCMQRVQVAWRLERWVLMDEYPSGAEDDCLAYSSSESNVSYDLNVAKILQAMMKRDPFLVAKEIALTKQSLFVSLATAGMDPYTHALSQIIVYSNISYTSLHSSCLRWLSIFAFTISPRDLSKGSPTSRCTPT
ncbi:hypothetical protein KIW84_021610 [Lathyrus oleraceus]|uniref:Uncharacterized protein n=1 Tax=Pisum sativum TaxID=3888 RepID=A0A9D5B9L3_PEA|nr:hypothetical protein KIW84_021610 [Pisum sativum]